MIKCYDAEKQSIRELAIQFKAGKTQIGTILITSSCGSDVMKT